MDVTPLVPADRQVIEGYGANSFRVSGTVYRGAVLVFPDATEPWAVSGPEEVTAQTLAPVVARGGVGILLLGCGRRMRPVAPALRQALRQHGIVVEAMDTGAACRTYGVLLAEGRPVAAALLPMN